MAMTTMTHPPLPVVGGVDTHKDTHVAAIVNTAGELVATAAFPNDRAGYQAMLAWMNGHGMLERLGVEGTGSYGAGLARFLTVAGVEVLEVNRPDRRRRRLRGKSDPVDAHAAARAALARDLVAVPKSADGIVEAIRAVRIPRKSAMKARTQVANQIHTLIDTAPDELRANLRDRKIRALVDEASRWRPGKPTDPYCAHRFAIHHLARRWQALTVEIALLDAELAELTHTSAPRLLQAHGVGTETAATLLVAGGDNPARLASEASFAALCGVSPVDRSSGRNQHHGLNRGGNREANSALWRIALVRMATDPETRAYIERRTRDGKTKRQIMRCLKRYIARELYPLLIEALDNQ
jgi:transposase